MLYKSRFFHIKGIVVFVSFMSIVISGYAQEVENFINPDIKVDEDNVPLDELEYYFPLSLFPEAKIEINLLADNSFSFGDTILNYEVQDTFVVKWYSEHLFAFKEPLLFNKQEEKETYRFTWLRTFHEPVVIRIEKDNEKYKLFWKVNDGAGGYESGKTIVDKSKNISRISWLHFKKLLKNTDFWNKSLGRISLGTDGSEWILEGNDSKRYRVVSEHSPSEGDFYDLCDFLIKLTNYRIKKKERY